MDWVAVGGVVVGICALVTTVYQAHFSRQHNRLSVRPHLTRTTHLEKDGLGATYMFSFTNCGIGPAIIVDRHFFVDGERFPSYSQGSEEVAALVDKVIARKFAYELLEHGLPGKESALSPGETFTIAKIRFPVANGVVLKVIEAEINRIDIVVTYDSMYGERFELVST